MIDHMEIRGADEPSIGLHPLDVETLIHVFDILIEHNLDIIKNSDYIIDMGPEGGQLGGEIIATGTVEDIKQNKNSKIGKYLIKHPVQNGLGV